MTTTGYVGTYTKKEGKGIYRFELDEAQGKLTEVTTGYELEASTYVQQHGPFLYAITKEGEDCGLASLRINDDGTLTLINQCLASQGGTGCYVDVSADGRFIFEAVYGNGLARIYEADPETGEIKRLIQEVAHQYPTGPKERQDGSHVHFLSQTPDGHYAVAMDLGTDKVVTYQFDEDGLHEYKVTDFEPGDGPRHITFYEDGHYAYIVHELSNYVSVVSYDDGAFEELERHLTIPEDAPSDTKLAAVRLSHDQQFLYISNRGDNSIAIFKVQEAGSSIELVDIVKSEGDFPRDFNITASDDYLVCAHQQGGYALVVFKRNKATGQLTLVDKQQTAPEGVCVQFLK